MSERVWVDGNGEETAISRYMGEQIERVLSEHPLAKTERRCPVVTTEREDRAMTEWIVEACTCGFGGGDAVYEFDTEAEARDFAAYLDRKTDATVRAVRLATAADDEGPTE